MKHTLFLLLIALTQIESIFGDHDTLRDKRQALPDVSKWPNNTMIYYYENLPLEMQAMFRDAFEYLSSHTCIKFKYDKEAETKVKIVNREDDDNCWSRLGMESWHAQELTLGYSCAAFGVAVHETMHSLGIAHAQSRHDRDEYLIVDSNNHNDEKRAFTINPVPFDYGSVMLYERGDNRTPRDQEYNFTMGSLRVAFYDMILLNTFYECNCDNHPIKLECKNGGYQNPASCDKCLCTDGFTGQLCDKLEGYVFNATTEWQKTGAHVSNKKGIDHNTMPLSMFMHVTAPEGSTIEVRITKLKGFYCHDTCDWNGVELKYKTDRRIVSPLVCCDDDNLWNKTRSSTNNPFVIVKYGDNRTPSFEFEYRYIIGNSTASGTKI